MLCLLSALLLCSCRVACKYGSISHSKGVFSGFPLLAVGLYCSGALRGLWGFCVREQLGGFVACGVFAPIFIVLQLFFFFFAAFLLCLSSLPALSICVVFVALWVYCWVFFFPCGL